MKKVEIQNFRFTCERKKKSINVFKKNCHPTKSFRQPIFRQLFFFLHNGDNGWPPIGLKFFVAKVDKKLRPFPTIFRLKLVQWKVWHECFFKNFWKLLELAMNGTLIQFNSNIEIIFELVIKIVHLGASKQFLILTVPC